MSETADERTVIDRISFLRTLRVRPLVQVPTRYRGRSSTTSWR